MDSIEIENGTCLPFLSSRPDLQALGSEITHKTTHTLNVNEKERTSKSTRN
jgi:hypothetical protein